MQMIFVLLILVSGLNGLSGFYSFHSSRMMKLFTSSKSMFSSSIIPIASTSFSASYISSTTSELEILKNFFDKPESQPILYKLALSDQKLKTEIEKFNFWTRDTFLIQTIHCLQITFDGIEMELICMIRNKKESRFVKIAFPLKTSTGNVVYLKDYLIQIVSQFELYREAGEISKLSFGRNYQLPTNLLLNNVPHANWVRNFLYRYASDAVIDAIDNPTLQNKSKLRITINVPELNPEFDTYRIGTLLELVRDIAISLLERKAYRIRICVQQSLGEGIRSGLPISLGSVRMFLERMDWGSIPEENKFQPQDNVTPRSEALIRFGQIGKNEIAPDDDIVIIIAPQNSIGGMVTELLKDMIGTANGRPVILINPNLKDKPSSDNLMSTAGRGERMEFANSFQDIFTIKLLYPGSGGMFPIRGMLAKYSYNCSWILYEKTGDGRTKEIYEINSAFPPQQPPESAVIGRLLDSNVPP